MTSPERSTQPTTEHKGTTASRPPLHDLLLLLAVVLFGLSVRSGALNGVAVIAASGALVFSIAMSRRHRQPTLTDNAGFNVRLLIAVGLFGLLGAIGWSPSLIGQTTATIERLPGAIFLVLAVAAFVTRRITSPSRYVALVVTTLLTVGSFGTVHIESMGDFGFDVYHLHVAAADAILEGKNPYTDAVVVRDGSPNAAPGDVITGYVYPPITGFSYALGHWLSPDARYAGLAAWLAVLLIVGISAVRQRSDRNLYLMMLLGSVPGLWLVLRAAWTEPLSLMFMAIAVAVWARPGLSGLGVGALVASKQYLLVTAPVLLLHRDEGWLRRLVFASIAVAVTIGPALLWDFGAFWDSAVAFHTTTEPRADSVNLVGLLALTGVEWAPATVVPLGLGILAGTWAGWGSRTRRSFLLASALALSASFLVTSQAFANYWFLVFGLCVLALLDEGGPTGSD